MKPTFIQPCFIRKNTPDLRRKLEELGYRLLFSARNGYGEGLCACHNTVDGIEPSPLSEIDVIDCGTNEDLFLAVAALRSDSDKFQWFTDGELWEKSAGDVMASHYMQMHGHKATVEELIEHFKCDNQLTKNIWQQVTRI